MKDAHFCLQTQWHAGSLPWAPKAFCEVYVSIKDSSPHLGLSPTPLSLSLCSQHSNKEKEEREAVKGSGPLVSYIAVVYKEQQYSFRFKKPGIDSWFCCLDL